MTVVAVFPSYQEISCMEWPNNWPPLPVESVCICGGEPLTRKSDVIGLTGRLLDNNVGTVSMTTNGTLITEDVADEIASSGMSHVQISIDGLSRTHNWLRRDNHAFDLSMRAIDILLERDVDVVVSCAPNRENLKDIPLLMRILDTKGVSLFRMQPVMDLGRARGMQSHILSSEEYLELVLLLRSMSFMEGSMKIEWGDPARHIFNLVSGNRAKIVFLDPEGSISLSPFVDVGFGSISRHFLEDYINHGLLDAVSNSDLLCRVFEVSGERLIGPSPSWKGSSIRVDIVDDIEDIDEKIWRCWNGDVTRAK